MTSPGRCPPTWTSPATPTRPSSTATPSSPSSPPIRERGYAVNDQGRFEGVIGVAAPVIGRDGIARAAVGVQGPTSRLGPDQLPEVAARVLEAAEELSVLPILDRL